MTNLIWNLKSDKIVALAKAGKRVDERSFDEYRPLRLDFRVSDNADGACRVHLGDTQVVCGVKMVPMQPFPDKPHEGSLTVGVEMLPIASESFEAGPPSTQSIELSRVVDRGIRESKCIDFAKWSIAAGELAFTAYVDLYTLDMDGNLFDACSIAAMASLSRTRVPKLDAANKIEAHAYAGTVEIVKKPVLCTFVKIASTIMVDPNQAEEHAASARFSVAVTEDDLLCAFQKGGNGSLTLNEINSCIEIALRRAKDIRKHY